LFDGYLFLRGLWLPEGFFEYPPAVVFSGYLLLGYFVDVDLVVFTNYFFAVNHYVIVFLNKNYFYHVLSIPKILFIIKVFKP